MRLFVALVFALCSAGPAAGQNCRGGVPDSLSLAVPARIVERQAEAIQRAHQAAPDGSPARFGMDAYFDGALVSRFALAYARLAESAGVTQPPADWAPMRIDIGLVLFRAAALLEDPDVLRDVRTIPRGAAVSASMRSTAGAFREIAESVLSCGAAAQ